MVLIKKIGKTDYEVNGKPVTTTEYKDKLNAEEVRYFEQYLLCAGKLNVKSSIY